MHNAERGESNRKRNDEKDFTINIPSPSVLGQKLRIDSESPQMSGSREQQHAVLSLSYVVLSLQKSKLRGGHAEASSAETTS
jgi:hypothetical protein